LASFGATEGGGQYLQNDEIARERRVALKYIGLGGKESKQAAGVMGEVSRVKRRGRHVKGEVEHQPHDPASPLSDQLTEEERHGEQRATKISDYQILDC